MVLAAPLASDTPNDGTDLARVGRHIAAILCEPISVAGDPSAGFANDVRLVASYRYQENGEMKTEYHSPSRVRIAEDTYERAVRLLRTLPNNVDQDSLKLAVQQPTSHLGRLWALGEELRLGDETPMAEVATFLSTHNEADSQTAMILGSDDQNGPPLPASQIPNILKIMQSKDPNIRRQAVNTLDRIQMDETSSADDPALPPLIALLRDRDRLVSRQAATVLCLRTDKCDDLNIGELAAKHDFSALAQRVSAKE